MNLLSFSLVILSILLNVFGQICLKIGSSTIPKGADFKILNIWRIFLEPYILLGLIIYFLGALTWIVVLSRVRLNYAYPMLSLSYVLVIIASYFIFKEPLSLIRFVGILIIIFGVIIISINK